MKKTILTLAIISSHMFFASTTPTATNKIEQEQPTTSQPKAATSTVTLEHLEPAQTMTMTSSTDPKHEKIANFLRLHQSEQQKYAASAAHIAKLIEEISHSKPSTQNQPPVAQQL